MTFSVKLLVYISDSEPLSNFDFEDRYHKNKKTIYPHHNQRVILYAVDGICLAICGSVCRGHRFRREGRLLLASPLAGSSFYINKPARYSGPGSCGSPGRGRKIHNIMNTQRINFHVRKLGEDQTLFGTFLDIKIYIGRYVRTFIV